MKSESTDRAEMRPSIITSGGPGVDNSDNLINDFSFIASGNKAYVRVCSCGTELVESAHVPVKYQFEFTLSLLKPFVGVVC